MLRERRGVNDGGETIVKKMNKTATIALGFLLALSAVACGSDPTKEETCGTCSATYKSACEAGYDLCADTSNCNLGDYKEGMEAACP